MSTTQRWVWSGIFAMAMGYAEAAVVFYLRTMVNRLDPYQPEPLPNFAGLARAEIAREAATMVMIFTAGVLAGRTWRGRIGYALLIFGIWDIAYYLFLRPLTGWPRGLSDWDILFLIPLPWWGPIWAPMSIALLMIAFGLLTTAPESDQTALWPSPKAFAVCGIGIAAALYVFMSDAIRVVGDGEEALRNVLPVAFQTPLFLTALLFMSVPVAQMARISWSRSRPAG